MEDKALIQILLCTDGKWAVVKEKFSSRICSTWSQVEQAVIELLQIPSAVASCETDKYIDGAVREYMR